MERLTEEKQIGPWACLKDKAEAKPGAFADYDCLMAHMTAVTRLKKYEDTGLEPEEIAEYQRVPQGYVLMGNELWWELEQLRQAKTDGRLVVLPCKVGDTVYFAAWFGTEPHVVDRIIEPFFYTHDARDMGSGADFFLRDFGHSVSLSREEAEKALRGGNDNG